jgi:hypothetical protein
MLFSEDYRQPRVNLIRIAVINHAGPQPLVRRRISGMGTSPAGTAMVLRHFDDPGAAAVFGCIMRLAKRLGLFYFAWCARNESHVPAYATEM